MKSIILGRDGVINHYSETHINSVEEWKPIKGSLEAIARLNHAGYHVAIATNQPGIGEQAFDVLTLDAIHSVMHQALAKLGAHVDIIAFCPHTEDQQCNCRKPLPGLLTEIASRWGTTLSNSPVIGDGREDLEAGVAAGAIPVLVRTGKGDQTLSNLSGIGKEVSIYENLSQAVDALLTSGI